MSVFITLYLIGVLAAIVVLVAAFIKGSLNSDVCYFEMTVGMVFKLLFIIMLSWIGAVILVFNYIDMFYDRSYIDDFVEKVNDLWNTVVYSNEQKHN